MSSDASTSIDAKRINPKTIVKEKPKDPIKEEIPAKVPTTQKSARKKSPPQKKQKPIV